MCAKSYTYSKLSSLRFKVTMKIIPFYFCNLTYIFTRIVGFIDLELVWMMKSGLCLMGDSKGGVN